MSQELSFSPEALQDFRTLTDADEKFMAVQQWFNFLTEIAQQPDQQQILLDHIEQMIEMVQNPDSLPLNIVTQMQTYQHIAETLQKAGIKLDQAADYAQHSLNLLLEHGSDGCIAYEGGSIHFDAFQYKLTLLNLNGQIQYRLGKIDQAMSLLDECVEAILQKFAPGFETLPHGTAVFQNILLDCGAVYQGAEKTDRAEQCYRETLCLSGGKNAQARERWEQIYVQRHGTTDGFRNLAEEAVSSAVERYKQGILKNSVDEVLEDFSADDIDGNRVRFSDLRGRVVVLGFGYHCDCCQFKLPFFQAATARYIDDERVVFLWILDGDTTDDEVRDYRQQHEVRCTMLRDTGRYLDETGVFWQLGIQSMPQVFIIDPNGHVRYKEIGHPPHDPAYEIDYTEAISWKIESLLS